MIDDKMKEFNEEFPFLLDDGGCVMTRGVETFLRTALEEQEKDIKAHYIHMIKSCEKGLKEQEKKHIHACWKLSKRLTLSEEEVRQAIIDYENNVLMTTLDLSKAICNLQGGEE